VKYLAGQIAIYEALNPTLAVTEQVLASHKLGLQDNIPKILSIKTYCPNYRIEFEI
jgi:hypothetical protein